MLNQNIPQRIYKSHIKENRHIPVTYCVNIADDDTVK